jgi:uncharacterized membrane protein YccC
MTLSASASPAPAAPAAGRIAAPFAAPLARLRALSSHLVTPVAALHGARTAAAALLALWLAFAFQLDTPYSALTTVVLVANPVQGMILEKSLYRLGGTLLGGLAALLLMGLFAQQPELFLLGLAAWMALCTAASTLLRGHRAYGAVLSGYTVALIALPVAESPDSFFNVAMARIAAVTIGVVASAFVGALLSGHTARRRLDGLLRETLAGAVALGRAALCAGAAPSARPEALSARIQALSARLGALDDAIRFAVAETPAVAADAPALRAAAAALHGGLSAAAGLREIFAQADRPDAMVMSWARAADALLAQAEAALSRQQPEALEQAARGLREFADEMESFFAGGAGDPRDLTEAALIAADRLADFLDEMARGLAGLLRLDTGRGALRGARNATHRDWPWAGLNAARAAIAVLVAGALWLGLAWPQGPMMMLGVVPTIGLLAVRERPSADVVQFAWGTVAAALLGLFYLLWVLPQIDSFALLAMWLAPPLALGVAAATTPAAAFFAQGFCVFLVTLLAPANPMIFDPGAFLNNAYAITAGCALTALVYQIVLPVDARRLRRHLLRELQKDVMAAVRGGPAIDPQQWESRMHDRMRLLSARLRAADIAAHPTMGAAFDALRLGREVLRLRGLLAMESDAAEPIRRALAAIAQGSHRVEARENFAAARQCLEARRRDLPEQSPRMLRAEAALSSIATLYLRRAPFFRQAARA